MTVLQSDRPQQAQSVVSGDGILILGMHRSGTSATTRVVNLAGVPLAEESDLWRELPGNETGYWESSSLSRFNERLLHEAGGAWWRPPEESAVAALADRPDLVRHATTLFSRLHGSAWAWKDPRVCLLLPFWRKVLPGSVRSVLVVRHPFEVAASLAARDAVPWEWSLALWDTYLRRAATGLGGLPVHVLRYSSLLGDPDRVVAALVAFVGAGGPPVSLPPLGAVSRFLRPDLRHSAYDEADLLASGHAGLLHLLQALDRAEGDHEPWQPPALEPASAPTRTTLASLARLDPTTSLPQAITASRTGPAEPPEENAMTTEQASVATSDPTSEWRTWIATNLLLDVAGGDVVNVLQQHGMTPEQATSEIAAVRQDPCFTAGVRIGEQLRKLESVLDMRHELETLSPTAGVLAHHPVVTREQFLTRYYAANRPVLIEGLVDDWPALSRWNPGYLREIVPDAQIEVMVDRIQDPNYEINSDHHKSAMRMADYVDAVKASGPSNDIYMVANNHFLENDEVAALWSDFTVPEIYLDAAQTKGSIFFWFGPGGTITPLHHDIVNVMFVQVHGSKRITLLSSLETHNLYNECSVYSSVDAQAPDLATYPKFARATRYDVEVGPGQALFIPVGWWHCVEALDTSISMSFTNFVWPNVYDWHHPDLRP
ncbi:MAG: cupin-like domain-containing protein [Actinomycetota bacterium]|nr:cupin-like domain-containing protein [Actinomycetota bacterium]